MFDNLLIWVRGAGEVGSAAAHVLKNTGFRVILSELTEPLAIRRTVTFSDAIYDMRSEVEGIKAEFCGLKMVEHVLTSNQIPLLIDDANTLLSLKPDIVIDARMLKRNNAGFKHFAPFTIGLGTGFTAGEDCHAVIETMRGHDLGRIIWEGRALADTGVPAELGGESNRRVIYSASAGKAEWDAGFGETVMSGDIIGRMDDGTKISAQINGMVRGLISPQSTFGKNVKIADIDPRGKEVDYLGISDKSRSIGRGVLEAVLVYLREQRKPSTLLNTL